VQKSTTDEADVNSKKAMSTQARCDTDCFMERGSSFGKTARSTKENSQ